jgi:hypothetical protein
MENLNRPENKRLHSLDALRGFDMFWIMKGKEIFVAEPGNFSMFPGTAFIIYDIPFIYGTITA